MQREREREKERARQSVCERERKTHAALSCLLNHRHQRTIQIHRDGEHKRDTHAIHLLHNKQLKKINLHVYIKQKYHLCMIITLILIVLIKTYLSPAPPMLKIDPEPLWSEPCNLKYVYVYLSIIIP